MITDKQKSEMNERKARAKQAQTAEMLEVRAVFGWQSLLQRKGKGKVRNED